jgi:hypothetical protein
MSWSTRWTTCRSQFSTSKFVHSKYTQTCLNGCNSTTNFSDGCVIVGSKGGVRPCNEEEKWLGPKRPYMAATDAVMYLASYTRTLYLQSIYWLYLALSQQNGIRMVSKISYDTSKALRIHDCFIEITTSNDNVDAGYHSDPHQGKLQTCYDFLIQGATTSWNVQHEVL